MSSITLEDARTIISSALKHRAEAGLMPLAVGVLDSGGHLVAFEREDGASLARFQIAFSKAYGAIALGVGSRTLMERAETQAYFVSGAATAIGGSLVAVPGGILIKDASGALRGAVGVSGDTSDNDEQCGMRGIEAAGYVADPG